MSRRGGRAEIETRAFQKCPNFKWSVRHPVSSGSSRTLRSHQNWRTGKGLIPSTEEYNAGQIRSNCSQTLYRNHRRTVKHEVRVDSPWLWPDSCLALAGGQQETGVQAAEVAGTAGPHGEAAPEVDICVPLSLSPTLSCACAGGQDSTRPDREPLLRGWETWRFGEFRVLGLWPARVERTGLAPQSFSGHSRKGSPLRGTPPAPGQGHPNLPSQSLLTRVEG